MEPIDPTASKEMCVDTTSVLIIGGGLGGLTLGQALQRRGIDFRIVERHPAGGRAGFRLHMNSDGGEALRDSLPPELFALYQDTSRSNPRKEQLTILDSRLRALGRRDHIGPPNPGPLPHTAVNRRTLREILLHGLSDRILTTTITGFEEQDDRVRSTLADGSVIESELLVGADGIDSAVRTRLLPECEVQPTGDWVIYGRAPITEPEVAALPAELLDGFVLALGRSISMGMGLFHPRVPLVEAAAARGVEVALADEASYMMIAGIVPGAEVPAGAGHFSGDQLKALFRTLVGGWDPQIRRLVDAIEADGIFMNPMRYVPPVDAWASRRVTLIGDAIHAMPPTFGAGANLAMRDAAVLARELDGAVDIVAAVGRYEKEMREYDYPILRMAISPQESAGGITPVGFLRLVQTLGVKRIMQERSKSSAVAAATAATTEGD